MAQLLRFCNSGRARRIKFMLCYLGDLFMLQIKDYFEKLLHFSGWVEEGSRPAGPRASAWYSAATNNQVRERIHLRPAPSLQSRVELFHLRVSNYWFAFRVPHAFYFIQFLNRRFCSLFQSAPTNTWIHILKELHRKWMWNVFSFNKSFRYWICNVAIKVDFLKGNSILKTILYRPRISLFQLSYYSALWVKLLENHNLKCWAHRLMLWLYGTQLLWCSYRKSIIMSRLRIHFLLRTHLTFMSFVNNVRFIFGQSIKFSHSSAPVTTPYTLAKSHIQIL